MKNHLTLIGLLLSSIVLSHCKSGLVTMSNSCYDLINEGQQQNKSGNYSTALDDFNKVLQKCDAYDAKEKGYAGKAAALNGLRQYSDALDAAGKGLAINKSSLDNLLEKAKAELELGNYAGARADLNAMVQLTGKNRNTAQRATLYSQLAEVDARQQQFDQALQDMQQAIAMDNANRGFYVQIVKIYQGKYKTTDAGVLGKKISAADRQNLCGYINSSKQAGIQDMGIDLVQTSICK